jgi:lipid II isoglutaminyl synthase (glutamine-hydrolysing)
MTHRGLRIVHLFPDVLRVYGDGGNVMTLVRRAQARSIATSVELVRVGADRLPPADLLFIGGGQDREQETVARELERLGSQLVDLVGEGAALLAVCGGYQNLGVRYLTSRGTELLGLGLFPISTDASGEHDRLVGPVVAKVSTELLSLGRAAERPVAPPDTSVGRGREPGLADTLVGFENHGGRTLLAAGTRPLATVELGHGNNDQDGTEGVLLLPNEGGLRGLRIGTYLHGPLLPRNPHVADALIAAAIGRGMGAVGLTPLDDRIEWAAHDAAVARLRRRASRDRRIPGWAHRAFDPIAELIGY